MTAQCDVCFHHCRLAEGERGFCGARIARDGKVIDENYGMAVSLALDPIEKKPLRRFHPGSRILSVGSYGCNLRCPFCQNHEISQPENAAFWRKEARKVTPDALADLAVKLQDQGNIGLAFTYNEPLVGWEFVRDAAALVHDRGLVNVLVSNGTAELSVLRELLPYIDAMNIDLKGFSDVWYRDTLRGNRKMVMDFIEEAAAGCHVEITTLVIPGGNDSEEEMRELSRWIASLSGGRGREIPLHITRFFPQYHMTDRGPTPLSTIDRLVDAARENLSYVYPGNC